MPRGQLLPQQPKGPPPPVVAQAPEDAAPLRPRPSQEPLPARLHPDVPRGPQDELRRREGARVPHECAAQLTAADRPVAAPRFRITLH
eukprot:10457210-Alexandrium_andersonii.AAC.1